MILQSEREHRQLKAYYACTNKNKFTWQCARHEQREWILQTIRTKKEDRKIQEQTELDHDNGTKDTHLSFEQADPLPQTSPQDHIHISQSKRHHIDLHQFVNEWCNDPGFHVSLASLLCVNRHTLTPFRTSFLILGHTFWGECWVSCSREKRRTSLTKNWTPWLSWVIISIITRFSVSTIPHMMVAGVRIHWIHEIMQISWCFLMRPTLLIHTPSGMVELLAFFMSASSIFNTDIMPPKFNTFYSSTCNGSVVILVSIWGSDTGDTHKLGSMTQSMLLDFLIQIKSFKAYIWSLDSIMTSRQLPWDYHC